ncbi:Bromodomain-containing protein [Exidia glandulosa HHB12029]|uniref:Bromodomain-containing protein n=1 Tax=Exidia glandulosa HHB12029 TaxID=1314781 RepID=A0A165MIG4_EXIGL|nr:Bromodomain-containing protein [Exidia glandulosa HHB12029]
MKRAHDSFGDAAEERRAKRQRAASYSDSDPDDSAQDGQDADDDLETVRVQGMKLYDAARLAVDKATQRPIAPDFMKVPPKKTYPDYYEIIKQPIALDDIKNFLDRRAFKSLEMVKAQFDLCFKNARKYNQKDSQIWRDAKALQKTVNNEYKKIQGIDQDDESDDDGKKEKKKNIARTMKNRLNKLTARTDDSGRILSAEFMDLPPRKIYPYYYREIQSPICFNGIAKRVKEKYYKTMEAFAADVNLVFDNAKQFNAEQSQIYEDADILQEYFRLLMGADAPQSSAADTKIKLNLKLPVAPATAAPAKDTTTTKAPKAAKPAKEETLPSSLTLRVPTKDKPAPPPLRKTETPSLPVAPATAARPPSPKLPVAPNVVTKPKPAGTPVAATRPRATHAPVSHPLPVPVPVPIHAPPPPPPVARVPYYPMHHLPGPSPATPASKPAAAPTPQQQQQKTPQVVYKYETPDPPAEARHPIAAAVVQTVGGAGRTWKLGAREGVRTWSVRLGRAEKTVRLAKLRFMDIDESDESEDEDGHETVVKLNGKPVEMPAADEDDAMNDTGTGNGSIGWEKELVQGMNVLEFGAKGGEVWKMYLDRP